VFIQSHHSRDSYSRHRNTARYQRIQVTSAPATVSTTRTKWNCARVTRINKSVIYAYMQTILSSMPYTLFVTICRDLFYFQWFVMRDDWSFYWYWWNCWPSLFKLSLHKLLTDDVDIRSMPILNFIQHTQCTYLRLVMWVSCGFSIVVTPYSSYHHDCKWPLKWNIFSWFFLFIYYMHVKAFIKIWCPRGNLGK
jgi:hypothetical protein